MELPPGGKRRNDHLFPEHVEDMTVFLRRVGDIKSVDAVRDGLTRRVVKRGHPALLERRQGHGLAGDLLLFLGQSHFHGDGGFHAEQEAEFVGVVRIHPRIAVERTDRRGVRGEGVPGREQGRADEQRGGAGIKSVFEHIVSFGAPGSVGGGA